ncbi:MAG: hypothetical protein GTO41_10785, partial [Burkholderiales bacterium]|nr:hypothetical protein [Burkholderiales bacterium]
MHLIQFSPDGGLVAIRLRDQTVQVYEVQSGRALCELDGHENFVKSIAFSPDSSTIVTAGQGDKETVKFWNANTGEQ